MEHANPMSKVSHGPVLKRLVTGILVLDLLVAGIICFSFPTSRVFYEEQAAITAHNISHVLEENISGTLGKVDIALQAVSDEAERQVSTGGIEQEALNRFIIREHSRLPELMAFRATDTAGDAIYGPQATVASTISLAHRNYFKILRDNPDAGMLISEPLVGGISGKWMLVLSRRINRPDGTFAGLVYAGVGLEHLTQIFKTLNVGAKGSITLLGEDLSLIARYPEPNSTGAKVGQKVDSPPFLEEIKSGKSSATYTTKSSFDGLERMFAYQRLSRYPQFYVLTGLATDEYLAGWRSEVYKMSLCLAVFYVVTALFACLLYRGWSRTRRAEQEVLKSEQRFRSFIENANDLIYTLSPVGVITYVAPNVEFLLGYSPSELIGTSFDDLVHQDDLAASKTRVQEIVAFGAGQSGVESRIRHKNGNWLWFHSNGTFVKDTGTGSPVILGIGRDITDRKKAEEALEKLNEDLEVRVRERTKAAKNANKVLQAIIDCTSDWVWDVDVAGRYTYCSPQVESYLGYRPDEMIGKAPHEFMSEEDASRVRRELGGMFEQHLQIKNFENYYIAKDGRKVLCLTNAVPVFDETGILTGYRGVDTDLTERRQAEETLKHNESFLSSLVENLPLMLFVKEAETLRFIRFNHAGEQLLGYGRDELIGKNDYDFFPQKEADFFTNKDREVLAGKEILDIPEEEIRTRYQGERILHTKKIPIADSTGNPLYLLGISEDITERKQDERFFNIQFELVRILSSCHDLMTGLRHCLSAAIQASGCDSGGCYLMDDDTGGFDLVVHEGLSDEFALQAAHYDAGSDQARLVLAGNPVYTLFRAMGIDFSAEVAREGLRSLAVIPLRYRGRVIGCLNIASHTCDDLPQTLRRHLEIIAEDACAAIARLKTEQALLASEEKYRGIFDESVAAVYVFDVGKRFLDSNQAGLDLLDYSREELLRLSIPDVDVDPVVVLPAHTELLAGGRLINYEHRLRRKDGSILTVLNNSRALTGPDGSVIGMQSTLFDITLRKQLEMDLQARNEELVRFVYTVSHDLKSPLVTIQTFLGFLEKDLAKNDAERVKTDFGYIDRAAIKMLDLLEELLELSRIGRKMNPAQDVPFEELVGAALDAVAGQIVERRVEISLNPAPLLLHGDRPRLTEVFQNLIDNAVKFMGDQPAPRIEIGVETADDEPVFYVRDNGLGIDPRHQGKLFGLFEKLHPGTSGTGMGLALVKRIVEVHGGRIWAESAGPGQGTTFRFTLQGIKQC